MSPRPASTRLSFRALWRQAEVDTNGELAEAVGVSRRTIIRWKKFGVPAATADATAAAVDLNPLTIWGQAWHHVA